MTRQARIFAKNTAARLIVNSPWRAFFVLPPFERRQMQGVQVSDEAADSVGVLWQGHGFVPVGKEAVPPLRE